MLKTRNKCTENKNEAKKNIRRTTKVIVICCACEVEQIFVYIDDGKSDGCDFGGLKLWHV